MLNVYYMTAPWRSTIITAHHTEERHLSLPIHYTTLFDSWIKYQKRGLFAELGSWEVLLCWHSVCLLTSHSRPHSGCFWLSAAIWNANRLLSATLKNFLPPLCQLPLPTASPLSWPPFMSLSPFHKEQFAWQYMSSKQKSHLAPVVGTKSWRYNLHQSASVIWTFHCASQKYTHSSVGFSSPNCMKSYSSKEVISLMFGFCFLFFMSRASNIFFSREASVAALSCSTVHTCPARQHFV